MPSNFVTGLDIGTSSIKIAVAENIGDKSCLRLVAKMPSAGMRKGVIVDLAEASQAIGKAIAEVKKFSRPAAKNIYLNIGSPQVKVQAGRGIVAVSRADAEIYKDDVERVVKASEAVNLAPNRTIIHNIKKEFIVDGIGDIADPIGLSGSRLEVHSLIIDAFAPHVKSLMRGIELGGGEMGGLFFSPLAASRSALSKNQKELGTVLVDIGFGTTGMSVYEEGKLAGIAKFPVGAGNISNDLAVGLKIPVAAAENVKLGYGYALARDVGHKETVDLKKLSADAKGVVSRRFVAEIIESRLAEIIGFVDNELKLWGDRGHLPGGVVLVGGGAKMPGLAELVRQELKLPSQVGMALQNEWEAASPDFEEHLEDPEFATVLGLVLWGTDKEGWGEKNPFSRFSVRTALKYFLP